MSAKCWQTRRRNKRFKIALRFVMRNPDQVVIVDDLAVLGIDVAKELGLL